MTTEESEGCVFTPIDKMTGKRLSLRIKDDSIVTRGPGYKGVVETIDGIRYAVWGAPCDLPTCYCDATAKALD